MDVIYDLPSNLRVIHDYIEKAESDSGSSKTSSCVQTNTVYSKLTVTIVYRSGHSRRVGPLGDGPCLYARRFLAFFSLELRRPRRRANSDDERIKLMHYAQAKFLAYITNCQPSCCSQMKCRTASALVVRTKLTDIGKS
ncbi:hypothetical protein GUJ93_ZPchr0013g37059 [Zizania palustris]|uniref:Uncharacterized protein n=1 Tax=Zizania palustris TaxID=103762 RepID=A0A8J5X091_ZIZPA|nr:hypothetical protein GUJ93_ZPchr0013g37059 [Zizania palustris]